MKTITVPDEMFTKEHPSSEGYYLWKNAMCVEMIHIYYKESCVEYGMFWDSYFAVSGHRGRNVTHLKGTFVKVDV